MGSKHSLHNVKLDGPIKLLLLSRIIVFKTVSNMMQFLGRPGS